MNGLKHCLENKRYTTDTCFGCNVKQEECELYILKEKARKYDATMHGEFNEEFEIKEHEKAQLRQAIELKQYVLKILYSHQLGRKTNDMSAHALAVLQEEWELQLLKEQLGEFTK